MSIINYISANMGLYDFTDKEHNVKKYITEMLIKTQSIFKYNNLPDTIPQRMLELYLQTNGNCIIAEYNKNLYAFTGGLGGEPNEYYQPTIYTVANPTLNFSKNFKINKDCVMIPNDSMWFGLLPMFRKYATQLVENDISLYLADVNTRFISIITATDDRTKKSADKYLDDILKGKLGIIQDSTLPDSFNLLNQNTSNSNIKNLIEYHQYIKANWYHDIGLNAQFNMKREALNSAETNLNNDALIPLIDDMLKCRQEAIEKINTMFNTNITVELNSAWQDNQEELDAIQNNLEVSDNDKTENIEQRISDTAD